MSARTQSGRGVAALMVAALVLAGAAVLAGCGGGDGKRDTQSEAFKKAYEPINNELGAAGYRLGLALSNAKKSTNKALAAKLTSLAAEVDQANGNIAALQAPPAKAKPALARLRTALRKIAADMRAIAAAATKHDASAARRATLKLTADAPAVKSANDEILRIAGLPVPKT